jgi:hypothetical protein
MVAAENCSHDEENSMYPQNRFCKLSLVIGIIFLFVLSAIQTSFEAEPSTLASYFHPGYGLV